MLSNIIKDVNIYLSYSSNDSGIDFTKIKGYDYLGWKSDPVSLTDEYLKFHLNSLYKVNNLEIQFKTTDFVKMSISYSKDNSIFTVLESDIEPSSIVDDIYTIDITNVKIGYLKIDFEDVTEVEINKVILNGEIETSSSDYNDLFLEYKKNENAKFLPDKLFENSDIKNIFIEYLNL